MMVRRGPAPILGRKNTRVISKSSSNKSNNNKDLQSRIVDAKTGKVIQKGNFNIKKSSGKDFGKKQNVSNKGQIGEINIQDTRSGITTKSKIDLDSGKTISEKSEQKRVINMANFEQFRQGQKQTRNPSQTPEQTRRAIMLSSLVNNSQDKRIVNKIITGQTTTVEERQRFKEIEKKKAEELSDKQLKAVGRGVKEVFDETIGVAYNYGKNAAAEANARGESVVNVFARDGIDVVKFAGKVVKGAYDYGKTSADKANSKGETVINVFGRDSKTAAALVATYAVAIGRDLKASFLNDPIKTTTKAIIYLFPGTIVKGIGGTVKAGSKGVKVGIANKKISSIQKKVTPYRGSLTLEQNNKLDKLINKLGDVPKTKAEEKLKTFARKVAKEQDIKVKRGLSSDEIFREISKKSDVIPIGDIKAKAKSTKKQPKRDVKIIDIKKGEVKRVSKKSDAANKKETKKRDTTKFVKVEGSKLQKITKKEFKKSNKKTNKEQPSRPIKLIDLKTGSISKVSENSVKLQRKDIFAGSKKGQVNFSIQRIQKYADDLKSDTKKIKRTKKLTKKQKKQYLKQFKKDLEALKKLPKVMQSAGLINIITDRIKFIEAATDDIDKLPAKDTPQKPKQDTSQKKIPTTKVSLKGKQDSPQKPKQDQPQIPAKDTPQKPSSDTPQKTKTPNKMPNKIKIPRKSKIAKKPKIIRLPDLKLRKLKKGERYTYNAVYIEGGKEKEISLKLPLKSAKEAAARVLDNTIQQTITRFRKVGITKNKDIKTTPTLNKKFNKAKTKKGITEKRKHAIDKPGEKKGLTIGKLKKKSLQSIISELKTKAKTENKKNTTIKKKSSSKKTVKKPGKKKTVKKTSIKIVKKPVKKTSTKKKSVKKNTNKSKSTNKKKNSSKKASKVLKKTNQNRRRSKK